MAAAILSPSPCLACRIRYNGWMAAAALTLLLAFVLPTGLLGSGLPTEKDRLRRLEQEAMKFAQTSLIREIVDATGAEGHAAEENAIRRAHRKIARRYRQNLFSNSEKFEFQMRILNLARDALVRGEHLNASRAGADDGEAGDEDGRSGRELPPGNRMSEEILKQIFHWQEFCLEEGIRFDDDSVPYFVGHTQHAFREAFEANWTHFVRSEMVDLWPGMARLRLQVELSAGGGGIGSGGSGAARHVNHVGKTVRQLARDALVSVVETLHQCSPHGSPLAGYLPLADDTAGWVALQLKASRHLRSLFAASDGDAGVSGSADALGAGVDASCGAMANQDARMGVLEIDLQALELLGGEGGDGQGRADVVEEIRATHAAIAFAREQEATPPHCRDVAASKRAVLEHLWGEYLFGVLINEAYPVDACSLLGLSSFLGSHIGPGGELLERRAEPDRTMLRALRGLVSLQRALARPAALLPGQWREAVGDLEDAVWQGVAFPELHEAAGRLMAEVANAGFLPDVLEVALEHPPVHGPAKPGTTGETLRHGREPGDVQPKLTRRFGGLDVPGYSLRPIERYEEKSIALWGDEDVEERWDPVRLGLSYMDLVAASELPIQVAYCFMSAALWFWRALQLLGDRCGGDGWLESFIFEDLWSVSPEAKRLAMQFALKRAILELTEYASNLAEHMLLPGSRLAVQRTAYLLIRKVTERFGASEDAPLVVSYLRRMFLSARLNPFWAPPVTQVSDTVFVDILSGRLHASFLEGLQHAEDGRPVGGRRMHGRVIPHAVLEYSFYEGALFGAADAPDVTYARFEAMGALLEDAGWHWDEVEALLAPAPLPIDTVGFAAGDRPGWPPPGELTEGGQQAGVQEEFVAVRGVRVNLGSGEASLLLGRPGASAPTPLLAVRDLVEVLGIADLGPLFLTLDPPTRVSTDAQYPHHPFQQATIEPEGVGRRTELALLHVALTLQQVASGTEVAVRAPFPLRPCGEGLCRGLPGAARAHVTPIGGLPGESWDAAPRLFLECARLTFWQRVEGQTLEIFFGEPVLEVHPGKPLRMLGEEEFRTWSVDKLRRVLRAVEREGGLHGESRRGDEEEEAALPVLEKQELVERLLRAIENGKLLEDSDESADPLARFSRRFVHHLPAIAERWPQLARMAPMCALRAAGLVLRQQLQEVNESARAQGAELRASADVHVRELKEHQAEDWRRALGEVHARALAELGFVDLDPGQCWDVHSVRNFAKCCSVGEHEAECWRQRVELEVDAMLGTDPAHRVAAERLRCCGPASRRSGFSMQLIASIAAQLGSASPRRPRAEELIPAVSAWLQNPMGHDTHGALLSGAVVDLLTEEIDGDAILRNTEAQLRRPADRLAADIDGLGPGSPGLLPSASGTSGKSDLGGLANWVPVPALASSAGRRTLYATVAFTPQLQQLTDGEAHELQAQFSGSTVELALGDLVRLAQSWRSEGKESPRRATAFSSADPEIQAFQETGALLQALDSRTEAILDERRGERRGAARSSSSTRPGAVEQPEASDEEEDRSFCSADGWRELQTELVAGTVGFGDRVRLRQRMGEDVGGEKGVVRNILALSGEPGELELVWEVDLDTGLTQYLDFADPSVVVAVVCGNSGVGAAASDDTGAEEGTAEASNSQDRNQTNRAAPWPACIESNVASPSLNGSGLFVNLGAFDISTGCFLGDCGHSDHFACASPAECARTCSRIGACRFWTFREAAPATCWLRGDEYRCEESPGAISGSVACSPPKEEPERPSDPTLFQLVSGSEGTLPSILWEEWDLVSVLEEFGHMTLDEVRRTSPSTVQRAALRASALATSRCATSWQGCA